MKVHMKRGMVFDTRKERERALKAPTQTSMTNKCALAALRNSIESSRRQLMYAASKSFKKTELFHFTSRQRKIEDSQSFGCVVRVGGGSHGGDALLHQPTQRYLGCRLTF